MAMQQDFAGGVRVVHGQAWLAVLMRRTLSFPSAAVSPHSAVVRLQRGERILQRERLICGLRRVTITLVAIGSSPLASVSQSRLVTRQILGHFGQSEVALSF